MIVDLFAGPGGWDEGLRLLGRSDVVGIEWDMAACRTALAAGHARVRADVSQYPPERFVGYEGLIASPPCQDFSLAGKRAGRGGAKGQLIDIVPEWIKVLRPSWVACEQVPPALDVWYEFSALLRSWGYSTWAGVLNAADFGVPQTRKRAFLLASLDGMAMPPEPTHDRTPAPSLFGNDLRPWVTMAEALGWGATERPVPTIHAGKTGDGRVFGSPEHGSNVVLVREFDRGAWVKRERSGDRSEEGFDPHEVPSQALTSKTRSWEVQRAWAYGRPATTIVGSFSPDTVAAPGWRTAGDGPRQNAPGSIKITPQEALTLQSFRSDYPVQGSRTKQFEQIGNAVPPLLAAHVLSALTGSALERAA